jgi:hypothetical protein
MAGGGGREVNVNPEHVVCILDVGENRTQIVTTGLSNAASMSLVVEAPYTAVLERLREHPGRT